MSRAAGPVSAFIDRHFRHFNAAALTDAADAYSRHLDAGGRMLVTLGGDPSAIQPRHPPPTASAPESQ